MNLDEIAADGVLSEVISYETRQIVDRALGSTMTAMGGREYIDFASGVAVHACGHSHPEILAAIARQVALTTHTADVMRHAPELLLAERIASLAAQAVPGSDWSVLFLNSGSESVDAAAKLAVKATGRTHFLAFDGAFHGRTVFTTALSRSKRLHWDAYDAMIAVLRPHIHHAPSPRDPEACATAAEGSIAAQGHELAAVIFEPQQGEGGYVPFAPQTARRVVDAARAAGALAIVDEVQSGFGRTGRWFGFEHLGIDPDIVVFGKAVGGGLPLAGLAARRELMDQWRTGEHGTTFGGNPLACAAGLAALNIVERDGLMARADQVGTRIRARLQPSLDAGLVADVRGWGLMVGVELRDPSGAPDYDRCERVKADCHAHGLLVLACGARIGNPTADNSTLRLVPALNIPDNLVDAGMDILVEALRK